ncbi:MAG TPA: type IV pilus modification protein PilV [Spongiibacteraceae bacterium]|nr:type IV pilus modification protein PilV [Spongiibacteraceae bacterium]HCS26212.1 type IV pilus modification protein PilV [Spongiibacteraceae bacterium]|tara:strand:+ start:670 stop:1119 length:450 start_codon:yes stop_codon:yes gene_type:complete
MVTIRRSAGFSLIEVLVALVVTALGVVGLVAAQLNALKYNQTSDVRTHATLLAYDIADRLRANRLAALAGSYDIALGQAAPPGTAVHQLDLRDWRSMLDSRLTSGDGSIARNTNRFTITVRWDESRIASTRLANADGSHLQTFVFVTEL